MAPDPGIKTAVREVRLEGASLAAALVVLLALLFGAFEIGRAVERIGAPARGTGGAGDPAARLDAEPLDASEKVTFFDTVSGAGKEAEPKRQASSPPPSVSVSAPATPGPWFVQVFVGRDRSAAEEVVRGVRQRGYRVRVDSVSEGASGSLYKVRVGGYESREGAEAASRKLEADGQKSTWVVKIAA